MSSRQRLDRAWRSHQLGATWTATWRHFYAVFCRSAGLTNAADHLPLSEPFHPHNPNEASAAHASILRRESSTADDRVVVFTLSYDHDTSGSLSLSTWRDILSVLQHLVGPDMAVQLWVDRIDAASRTSLWGIAQLLPYVLLPVIRVGSRPDPGFWSNMEGLAGIFGWGLFHDRSLHEDVLQDMAPVKDAPFFFSRASTMNPRDAIETFYVHLMYGCLTKYRNHHREALQRLRLGATVIGLTLGDASNFVDTLLTNERDSVVGDGRFEILNDWRGRTDIPGWQGLKEWITIDSIFHPFPALSDTNPLEQFRLDGFVNVYYNDTLTMAVIHWRRGTWTRRLLVGLTQGSREEGKALWHKRTRGYRKNREREEIDREHGQFVSTGLPNLYRFDSINIHWK